MIISNSSPLIALGRLNRLDIVEDLFGNIYIPHSVYQETVVETSLEFQSLAIRKAIESGIIVVTTPTIVPVFKRKLDKGEQAVLALAIEKQAQAIIMDDRKARKEATERGFSLFYTTDILKGADRRHLISYLVAMQELRTMKIYLPEM